MKNKLTSLKVLVNLNRGLKNGLKDIGRGLKNDTKIIPKGPIPRITRLMNVLRPLF